MADKARVVRVNLAELDDVTLGELLKVPRRHTPHVQVRVMRALIERCTDGEAISMPNLSELGRKLGVTRQHVASAVASLQRKGAVAVIDGREPVIIERRARQLRITLDPDQLPLPFPRASAPVIAA